LPNYDSRSTQIAGADPRNPFHPANREIYRETLYWSDVVPFSIQIPSSIQWQFPYFENSEFPREEQGIASRNREFLRSKSLSFNCGSCASSIIHDARLSSKSTRLRRSWRRVHPREPGRPWRVTLRVRGPEPALVRFQLHNSDKNLRERCPFDASYLCTP
jgi:hypothetical protein